MPAGLINTTPMAIDRLRNHSLVYCGHSSNKNSIELDIIYTGEQECSIDDNNWRLQRKVFGSKHSQVVY